MHTLKSVVYHLTKHISIDLNIQCSVTKRQTNGQDRILPNIPKKWNQWSMSG